MNPSTTQQHRARSMKHWMLARAFPTTYLPTAPPTTSSSYYLPSSGGGRRQHLHHQIAVRRRPLSPKGATPHLIAGGDSCSALATSPRLQLGVIRSVHRPYPLRPPRGEIRGILHSSSRQNSPWSLARLHLADSKRWGADYLESLSVRFSSTEYKPESFHAKPHSTVITQAEQTFHRPPCQRTPTT